MKMTTQILDEPFGWSTTLGLRVFELVRELLCRGEGPDDESAELLLSLLCIQWMSLTDARTAWQAKDAFKWLNDRTTIVVIQRQDCRAEIRSLLAGPTALALNYRAQRGGVDDWDHTTGSVCAWLRSSLPALQWPSDDQDAMDALDCLLASALRVYVPPYLLTAASPRTAAPTATALSVARLMREPTPVDVTQQLIHSRPRSTGGSRSKRPDSVLANAMKTVSELADSRKQIGENDKRMGMLVAHLRKLDTQDHLPAATYVEWVIAEAERWGTSSKGSVRHDDRLEIGSLRTYTSNITAALSQLQPQVSMRDWYDEWHLFLRLLLSTVPQSADQSVDVTKANRTTAFRRFVSTLSGLGYTIPPNLLDANRLEPHRGMRRSAASIVLTESDQRLINHLTVGNFADEAINERLARLYVDLRWTASLRSGEAGAFSVNLVTEGGDLVVTTGGFANLKSDHARRLVRIPADLADRARSIALMVSRARPRAGWIFSGKDGDTTDLVDSLDDAFNAAIKQATGEPDARAHAARAVAPLEVLFQGWEPLLRRFLKGSASTSECVEFCRAARRNGFGSLVRVLVEVGHGHPNAYISNYFALWDLVMAVHARASLAHVPIEVDPIVKRYGSAASAAMRQARHRTSRAGSVFDALAWMGSYRPANAHLPKFSAPPQGQSFSTPRTTRLKRPQNVPLGNQALYIALRITDLDPVSAADGSRVPTSIAGRLERLVGDQDLSWIRSRLQCEDAPRARAAEVEYLIGEHGFILAAQLAKSSIVTTRAFNNALSPTRGAAYVPPSLDVMRANLILYVGCLPKTLALLVQFGRGQLSTSQVLFLENKLIRIHVGNPDRDLGNRPRISVISHSDPLNRVIRARRTANVRTLLAAIDLIRDKFWSPLS